MLKSARMATWTALVAVLNPLTLLGEPPSSSHAPVPRVTDLALDTGGHLNGVVVTASGRRQAGVRLQLRRVGDVDRPQRLTSDKRGNFCSDPLRPGTYRIETSLGIITCRVWSNEAAPPAAAESVLVVHDAQVVRGQRPVSELFFSDPLLMAGVVAAAIAIPIAVHKSRDDAPPGS